MVIIIDIIQESCCCEATTTYMPRVLCQVAIGSSSVLLWRTLH